MREYAHHARDSDGNLLDDTIHSDYNWVLRKCVRCNASFSLDACKNCGGTEFGFCKIIDGGDGIYCKRCDTGMSRWTCPKCECKNSYATSLIYRFEETHATSTTEKPQDSGSNVLGIIIGGLILFLLILKFEKSAPDQPPHPESKAVKARDTEGASDIVAYAQPPDQLTQIDPCLYYKCGPPRIKILQSVPVFEQPNQESQIIGSLSEGTIVQSVNTASVTIKPVALKVKKRFLVDSDKGRWVEPNKLIFTYASWGEGCYTVWANGYLYGYFQEGHRPGGNDGFRKDLINCKFIESSKPVATGKSEFWFKVPIINNGIGWKGMGWIRAEEKNIEEIGD